MKAVAVNQNKLTSECWLIQFTGIEACENCQYKGKHECGGKAILKRIAKGEYPKAGIGTPVKC